MPAQLIQRISASGFIKPAFFIPFSNTHFQIFRDDVGFLATKNSLMTRADNVLKVLVIALGSHVVICEK